MDEAGTAEAAAAPRAPLSADERERMQRQYLEEQARSLARPSPWRSQTVADAAACRECLGKPSLPQVVDDLAALAEQPNEWHPDASSPLPPCLVSLNILAQPVNTDEDEEDEDECALALG
jgi:hypothetical protein